MAANNIVVQVSVQGNPQQTQAIQNNIGAVGTTANSAATSVTNLTNSVTANGGAMQVLDIVTGGYASQAAAALQATQLLGGGFTLARIQATLFGTATRAALAATGIGAILVAVLLLVEYWDDVTDAVGLTNKALERQKVLLDELTVGTAARLAKAESELSQIENLNNERKKNGTLTVKNLEDELAAFDKVEKKREKDNIATRKRLVIEAALLEEGSLERIQKIGEISKLNSKTKDDDVTADIERRALEQEAKDLEDQLAREAAARNRDKEQQIETGARVQAKAIEQEDADFTVNLAKDTAIKLAKLKKDEAADDKKRLAERKAGEIEFRNTALASASSLFGSLAVLSGKNEENQKAFAIAQVLTDSAIAAIGIWAGYSSFGPFGVPAAIAQTIALGAATIAAISQIKNSSQPKTPTPPPTPIEGTSTFGDEGVLGDDTAPPFAAIGGGGSSQIGIDIAAALQGNPLRAFVVSKDVTNAQELDRATINQATLGG